MHENLSEKSEILKRIKEKRFGKNVLDKTPKVSIIVPAFRVSRFINETLQSIFSQTYTNYEAIIINDGSDDSDELEQILKRYSNEIIYAKQDNFGASKARNLAIALSRGKYLAFLDGDDIWDDRYLESQIEFIEKSDLDMIYCDAELFGNNYFSERTYMKTSPSVGEVNSKSLIDGTCSVLTSGTVLKKEKLENFGLFDTSINGYEDFELWFRLAKNDVRIGYQRKVLLKYRVSSTSLSGSNIKRAERAIEVLELLDQKYDLTAVEKRSRENHLAICRSELELEKSKICLIEKKYSDARDHIVKANQYNRKPKLTMLKWLLKISPTLTLKLFEKLRPAEFSFINPNHM